MVSAPMAQRSPIWMRDGFCSCTSSINASSMRGSVVKPAFGSDGDHGIDLDQDLVAARDDVLHSAHRLVGDLADHLLHEIELLPGVLRRLAEIGVAVGDGDFGSFFHAYDLRRSRRTELTEPLRMRRRPALA